MLFEVKMLVQRQYLVTFEESKNSSTLGWAFAQFNLSLCSAHQQEKDRCSFLFQHSWQTVVVSSFGKGGAAPAPLLSESHTHTHTHTHTHIHIRNTHINHHHAPINAHQHTLLITQLKYIRVNILCQVLQIHRFKFFNTYCLRYFMVLVLFIY